MAARFLAPILASAILAVGMWWMWCVGWMPPHGKAAEVLEASDGPSGLEEARRKKPDVILLDVMMPALDGWRVAERLVDDASTQDIPIIFLTARAEFRDRARRLDIGGVDYVTKPFNPLELAALVRDLLSRIERGERDDLRREKLGELRALMEPE